MTRSVETLQEEDSLLDALKRMDPRSFRHMPVVRDGFLVGLVTHRDLLRLTNERDRSAFALARESQIEESTFVADVMTRDVFTVHPETLVEHAVRALLDAKVDCVPVISKEGLLRGIVTTTDVLQLTLRLLQ